MKKINIFLASSNELKDERMLFEVEVYRKCKAWFDKGIFLNLEIWEDLSAAVSKHGHSQTDYNKVLETCDIVVLLAFTKVGMYTAEEFETAYGQFKKTQKPFIFTYFKANPPSTRENRKDLNSLYDFQDKLGELGHFYGNYNDFNDLWNQFNKELERLDANSFEEVEQQNENDNQKTAGNTTVNKTNTSTNTGDGIISATGVEGSTITINKG